MPVEILMPALSPTMESGKLTKWHVSEGDEVAAGDVIAEIETDKATMEVEAVDEGVVEKILVQAGSEDVQVNAPIALISGDDAGSGITPQTPGAAPVPQALSPEPPVAAAAPAPSAPILADPEIPDGVQMQSMSVREALRDAMAEEMRRDDRVFVMGEEVAEYQGAYKVTQGLFDEFGGRRVIDTPITEHGFTGLGVGAAFAGLKPVIEFMTFNFAMQAIDHIINSAAKTHYMSGGLVTCPIVFRGANGAAARVGAQHSQNYASWYAHVPGLKVVAPYSAADAKGLLKAAIRDPNPVVFLENEILYGQMFDVPKVDDLVIPIGKARILREGTDVTLVGYSYALVYMLEAADILAEQGISAEIIDLRSLRPLDMDTVLASVKKTNRMVTVEETWPVCGIGAELGAQVMERAFDYLDAPVLRVTGKDVPMPYAANLEKLALPNAAEVVEAAKSVCYR
jgi:pyruvate dehydrogenase E1 component beta subunit